MKMTLSFVPPGGGETDYTMDTDLPQIPEAGDYISIQMKDEIGTRDFIVRRTWWRLVDGRSGKLDGISVECEFAEGLVSSEAHKESCAMYEKRGKGKANFDASMY